MRKIILIIFIFMSMFLTQCRTDIQQTEEGLYLPLDVEITGGLISSSSLLTKIKNDLRGYFNKNNMNYGIPDRSYFAPDYISILALIVGYNIYEKKAIENVELYGYDKIYTPDGYDCDNRAKNLVFLFTDMVIKMIHKYEAQLSVGEIWFEWSRVKEEKKEDRYATGRGGHAINILLMEDEGKFKTVFIEPQTSILYLSISELLKSYEYDNISIFDIRF